MPKRLTDRFIQSLKPPSTGRTVVADAAVEGLSLRITAGGARSWLVRFRPKKQSQRGVVLGPYPTIGLGQARARAAEIVAAAKRGTDLLEVEAKEAEARRRASERARTVREVSVAFLKACENLKSHRQRKSHLNNHILPAMGDKLIGEVRRADVVELLDEVEGKKGLRQTTNRVRETLLALFEFAIERQITDANPAAGAKRRRKLERKRERVLRRDEIKALWDSLDRLPEPVPAFVRTLMLTGCRLENARTMRWSEVDLDGDRIWIIPGSKAKAGRSYEIPLSKQMVEVLRGMTPNGPYVFSRDGKRPISGISGLKQRLDQASGLREWRLHDLRRSMRTGLAELGIIFEVAERCIGHAAPRLEATYNLYRYKVETARALQRWADYVMGIVKAEAGKVVELRPPSTT
jgi:integrase